MNYGTTGFGRLFHPAALLSVVVLALVWAYGKSTHERLSTIPPSPSEGRAPAAAGAVPDGSLRFTLHRRAAHTFDVQNATDKHWQEVEVEVIRGLRHYRLVDNDAVPVRRDLAPGESSRINFARLFDQTFGLYDHKGFERVLVTATVDGRRVKNWMDIEGGVESTAWR